MAHELDRETHGRDEDTLLLEIEEMPCPTSRADERMERAGLTPRQGRIAIALAHLKELPKQIAPILGCSEGTLRKHEHDDLRQAEDQERPGSSRC